MHTQLDYGLGKQRVTSDLLEKVSPFLTTARNRTLRQQLDDNRVTIETVSQLITSRKEELEEALFMWTDVERGNSDVTAWLNDVERRLTKESEAKSDLAEKKLLLHRLQVRQHLLHFQSIV